MAKFTTEMTLTINAPDAYAAEETVGRVKEFIATHATYYPYSFPGLEHIETTWAYEEDEDES